MTTNVYLEGGQDNIIHALRLSIAEAEDCMFYLRHNTPRRTARLRQYLQAVRRASDLRAALLTSGVNVGELG